MTHHHKPPKYQDGLNDLDEIKRTMLSTVLGYCLLGLMIAGCIVLAVALVHSSLWPRIMERFQ